MDFIKNNKVLYTILVFTIAVFVSLDMIILDEEALVLLCFVLFIMFLYENIHEMVYTELQNRADKIRNEFEETNLLQEDIYETLLSYYQKQLALESEIHDLLSWTKTEITTLIETRQQALENSLQKEVSDKLKFIHMKEQDFLQSMQEKTVEYLTSVVLSEADSIDDEVLEEGIGLIEDLPNQYDVENDPIVLDENFHEPIVTEEYNEEYDDEYDDDDEYEDEEDDENNEDDETENSVSNSDPLSNDYPKY
tara:strand:- start:16047 stop:16799 length:753 start_codon:yes stop_codon:yes gene_type:complete